MVWTGTHLKINKIKQNWNPIQPPILHFTIFSKCISLKHPPSPHLAKFYSSVNDELDITSRSSF